MEIVKREEEEIIKAMDEYVKELEFKFPDYKDLLKHHVEDRMQMEFYMVDLYKQGKELGKKFGFVLGVAVATILNILITIF